MLVANRGEIAVRVIRACHELGIEAVAVYSTADRDGAWVRLADRAVCIGPPPAARELPDDRNVIGAAETTGCDAVHPGYGFLRENAGLRARVRATTTWSSSGPTAGVDGDRWATRRSPSGAMRDAGMPLVPGSAGRLASADEARRAGRRGRATRCCSRPPRAAAGAACAWSPRPPSSEAAYATATAEAEAAFGDGGLYLEKAVVDAHHVEVQVLGDGAGGALVLGERDCSSSAATRS